MGLARVAVSFCRRYRTLVDEYPRAQPQEPPARIHYRPMTQINPPSNAIGDVATTDFEQPSSCPASFGQFAPPATSRWVLQALRYLPATHWARRVSLLFRRLATRRKMSAYDVEIYGINLRLHPNDNVTEKQVLCTPQFFDPEEREFIAKRLGGGFAFVDIGANAGMYSLFVASLATSGRVVAVEPDPVMFERLTFNKGANQFSHLEVKQAAISDRDGTATMYINSKNRGQNSMQFTTGNKLTVPCLTLLSLFDEFEIGAPDILKMDIEGLEYNVLKRFFDTAPVERLPRTMIIEQHVDSNDRATQLALSHGYRIFQRTYVGNVILELGSKKESSRLSA